MTQIKLNSNADWDEHKGRYWRVHSLTEYSCSLMMHVNPYESTEYESIVLTADKPTRIGGRYIVKLIATVGPWASYSHGAPYAIIDLDYNGDITTETGEIISDSKINIPYYIGIILTIIIGYYIFR